MDKINIQIDEYGNIYEDYGIGLIQPYISKIYNIKKPVNHITIDYDSNYDDYNILNVNKTQTEFSLSKEAHTKLQKFVNSNHDKDIVTLDPDFVKSTIDKYFDDPRVFHSLLLFKNLDSNQVNMIFDKLSALLDNNTLHPNHYAWTLTAIRDNVNPEYIECDVINTFITKIINIISKGDGKLFNYQYHDALASLLNYPNVTDEHIEKVYKYSVNNTLCPILIGGLTTCPKTSPLMLEMLFDRIENNNQQGNNIKNIMNHENTPFYIKDKIQSRG